MRYVPAFKSWSWHFVVVCRDLSVSALDTECSSKPHLGAHCPAAGRRVSSHSALWNKMSVSLVCRCDDPGTWHGVWCTVRSTRSFWKNEYDPNAFCDTEGLWQMGLASFPFRALFPHPFYKPVHQSLCVFIRKCESSPRPFSSSWCLSLPY